MKAVFLRMIEETQDKEGAIREAIASAGDAKRHEVEPASFLRIPRSPFAYWASETLLCLYQTLPSLVEKGRLAKLGGSTKNDERFLRLWWESSGDRWFLFSKGGSFSPFYSDVAFLVNWECDAREIEAELLHKYPYLESSADFVLHRENPYFRPGLTWPPTGLGYERKGMGMRLLPAGCIFGHKSCTVFVEDDSSEMLLALQAVLESSTVDRLMRIQSHSRSWEVGHVQRLPLPFISPEQAERLALLSHRAWALKRSIDTSDETSHAYYMPVILRMSDDSMELSAAAWCHSVASTESELARLQVEIDDNSLELYGIENEESKQDQECLDGASSEEEDRRVEKPEGDAGLADIAAAPLVGSQLSWTVGVAFGRFDLRLATGERQPPLEPKPFDPLPICSPGMLTGDDGLSLDAPPSAYPIDFPRDGILVEDTGADRDVVTISRQVFELIFEEPAARWEEAADILDNRDLRGWFAREFFGLHIKCYSKSRRKAPIYWQLATPSASYSAWLYYHRFTRDTLFRLLNDHITLKLKHEERRLTTLTQDAGPNPTASQRKEVDVQDTFVGELRAFHDEVARVAPLWNPNLNDGVILNFAPLWRLVPQHKAWQKECKSAWDKLCKGDYDWAYLAMHLWPERVVPKCATDRSLAIAHGLEEVFWLEGEDGKWQPKAVSEVEADGLVAERTSRAVKDALKSLIEAPVLAAGRGRAPRRKETRTRRAMPDPSSTDSAPSPGRTPHQGSSAVPDSVVLHQIRSAIATLGGNAGKSDILESAGLSACEWPPAIKALLAEGSVMKTGQKRGTRYHLTEGTS
jgi:hypothetical protein